MDILDRVMNVELLTGKWMILEAKLFATHVG